MKPHQESAGSGRASQLRGREAGNILPLVLIILTLGGLAVPPLLANASASLKAQSVAKGRVLELYAADSGFQDALYRIGNGLVSSETTYSVDNEAPFGVPDAINGKEVEVSVVPRWVLEGLEDSANGTTPHNDWVVVERLLDPNTYEVSATYDGSAGVMKLDRVGAFLPQDYQYQPGTTRGTMTSRDPNNVIILNGGTAYKWDFRPPINFPPGQVTTKTLIFDFVPSIPEPLPSWFGDFSWVRAIRNDIYLSWNSSVTSWRITSRAVDPATGAALTEVRSNVTMKGDSVLPNSWALDTFSN